MIYPTIIKIRELSGEDLVINLGNEEKAKAYVKQFSDAIYEELARVNIVENYHNIIKLIKTNKDWQNEFFRVISRLVFIDFNDLEKNANDMVAEMVANSPLLRLKRVIMR